MAADRLRVISGPWDAEQIEQHLHRSVIPVRLATAGTGWPLVQSMWFRYAAGMLWCATRDDAVVVRRLQREPRCGFEVAADLPPYRGVRGYGTAQILPGRGREVLAGLIDRYLGREDEPLREWLLSRADREVAIAIAELSVSAWDFSGRMAGG